MSWHDSNEEQNHFLSIATVINSAGKKHALNSSTALAAVPPGFLL